MLQSPKTITNTKGQEYICIEREKIANEIVLSGMVTRLPQGTPYKEAYVFYF